MSSRNTKIAAALVAVTVGAGGLAAAPLFAQGGSDGPRGGGHHHGPPAQGGQQPGGGFGVQPGTGFGQVPGAPATQPGTGSGQRGPAPGPAGDDQGTRQQGPDITSPRVGPGGDTFLGEGVRRGRSFRVSCDFVKSGMFDPIVFPGQDPAGHDHQFFGATTIDKDSTGASLVAANINGDATSCSRVRDGSAYWMPALQVADDPANPVSVQPDEIRVRYAAPRGQRVRTFPAGFSLVAGDKGATTLQDNAGWRCEFDRPGTPLEAAPPPCDTDEAIVGVVRFPNCWDGRNATSPTQAHMAYRVNGACPTTHPVAVPELIEEVFWPSDGQDHAYQLSSGNAAGLHADFINGWDQRALRNQVRRWLNRRG
ncbi:MAG: DUF1996 domain-containing protein [Actinomycetota bacterium]